MQPATGLSLGEERHELSNPRTPELFKRATDSELHLLLPATRLPHEALPDADQIDCIVRIVSEPAR
jgi:hypothetical protein